MSTSSSILIFTIFCFSCSTATPPVKTEVQKQLPKNDTQILDSSFEEDPIINQALDALNEIQVSGDGGMMLYLTFPNIYHKECEGAISTFEISRKEFHDALMDIMTQNNRTLTDEKRSKLATDATLPLERYTIKTCGATTEASTFNKGEIPPRKGTWIITEIFGASDVLINW